VTALNDNVLPLTPNAVTGSPDPNPLVTPDQYSNITKDTSSDVSDIEENLAAAVVTFCEMTHRTALYGNYTESQYLYPNGMVYPSATPIDINQVIQANVAGNNNIYDPASPGTDPYSSIIQGTGVWVGWFSPLPWMPFYTGVVPPQTILTYWGGWTNATLPPQVRRIIARIAYKYLNPVSMDLMGGVQSVSVGGVSVSGHLSNFAVLDPQLKRDIIRWRKARAGHGWQV
jgi:hypothetical protein